MALLSYDDFKETCTLGVTKDAERYNIYSYEDVAGVADYAAASRCLPPVLGPDGMHYTSQCSHPMTDAVCIYRDDKTQKDCRSRFEDYSFNGLYTSIGTAGYSPYTWATFTTGYFPYYVAGGFSGSNIPAVLQPCERVVPLTSLSPTTTASTLTYHIPTAGRITYDKLFQPFDGDLGALAQEYHKQQTEVLIRETLLANATPAKPVPSYATVEEADAYMDNVKLSDATSKRKMFLGRITAEEYHHDPTTIVARVAPAPSQADEAPRASYPSLGFQGKNC